MNNVHDRGELLSLASAPAERASNSGSAGYRIIKITGDGISIVLSKSNGRLPDRALVGVFAQQGSVVCEYSFADYKNCSGVYSSGAEMLGAIVLNELATDGARVRALDITGSCLGHIGLLVKEGD